MVRHRIPGHGRRFGYIGPSNGAALHRPPRRIERHHTGLARFIGHYHKARDAFPHVKGLPPISRRPYPYAKVKASGAHWYFRKHAENLPFTLIKCKGPPFRRAVAPRNEHPVGTMHAYSNTCRRDRFVRSVRNLYVYVSSRRNIDDGCTGGIGDSGRVDDNVTAAPSFLPRVFDVRQAARRQMQLADRLFAAPQKDTR